MNEAKKYFWIALDLFIAVLVVGAVFFGMPLLQHLGSGFYPARTITVTAEGKTTVSPDLAEISFSVLSQGQDPQALSTNNNDKMNAVLQFVKAQGIDDKDMTTTNYDLSPNYQYDKNTQRNFITGYTLTQTVQVKVRDLNKVATVLGGLAPLGVNQIGGVNFTFDDPEKFLAVARADAFVKVEAKAKEMATSAGVSLGSIVTVAENNYVPGPSPLYMSANSAAGLGGAEAAISVPTIQPGTQDVTDDVSITYELR
jgi:uncharacterized protein YggE